MKKNIIGMIMAAGLLLATSCSEDLSIANSSGNMQKVTFSLGLEGQIQTRGVFNGDDVIVGDKEGNGNIIQGGDYDSPTRISDGTRARHLILEVYTDDGKPYSFSEADGGNRWERGKTTSEDLVSFPMNISITLEKSKNYKIVFWADTPDNEYYDTDDLHNISIRYDLDESDNNNRGELNNDELRDAFCYSGTLTSSDLSAQTKEIILRRPLAQINVGTTDKDWEAVNANYPITQSKIKINYVGNSFNLVEDKAVIGIAVEGTENTPTKGMTVADYQYATIPQKMTNINGVAIAENGNELWVNIEQGEDGEFVKTETPQSYKWLSMCYILVPSEENEKPTTVDITELKFKGNDNSYELEPFPYGLKNVPVQRNHRTNIIGSILTEEQTFTVSLDEDFAGNFNYQNGEWTGEIADGVAYQVKAGDSKYNGFLSGLNFYVSSAKGLQWLADRSNKEQWKDKDIPAWFKGDLDEYKNFVFGIIDKRTFINGGIDRKKFDANDPWTYDECTIYLTKDIDWTAEMGDVTFRPFSMRHGIAAPSGVNHTETFKGTFDGQGHTISNLKIDTRHDPTDELASCGGLIAAATESPVLRNLRLYAADIKANWNVGGFVGRYAPNSMNIGKITMENCLLENSEIYAEVGNSPSNDANIGGLVGAIGGNENQIKNCHIRNTKLESTYIAGGLFGIYFGNGNNTTIENCSISDVAVIINEMNQDGNNTNKTIENNLYDEYWICGSYHDNGKMAFANTTHSNVFRNVFFGTRDRTADKAQDGMGEIDHLPLQWFPQLFGEWANGITLKSHITGTPSSYESEDGKWYAGLYISTKDENKNTNKEDAHYILCGQKEGGKPLYALTVQNPDANKNCYGVYITGESEATIKDLVINGDPSITAGIYLDKAQDVVLENVAIYDVETTIDDANVPSGATLRVTKCDLRGVTKFGSGYSSVYFGNTIFSKGSGTKENAGQGKCIPSSPATFENCVFRPGFTFDISKLELDDKVTFKNCTIGTVGHEVDLTKDNIKELFGEDYEDKATFE